MVKEIGDEEPYYSTKISIFSFIWAGLAALHNKINFPQSGPALQGCTVNVPKLNWYHHNLRLHRGCPLGCPVGDFY